MSSVAAVRAQLVASRSRLAAGGAVSVQRLRPTAWPIVQTSVAAGLSWYIAHTLLKHPQPFFAPIAAMVCLSASSVLRGQRAVQMMLGGRTASVSVLAFKGRWAAGPSPWRRPC